MRARGWISCSFCLSQVPVLPDLMIRAVLGCTEKAEGEVAISRQRSQDSFFSIIKREREREMSMEVLADAVDEW